MRESKRANGLNGLTEREVIASREANGTNTITRRKRKGFLRQYLSSFSDPVIRILLVALAVNVIFLFGNSPWQETAGIAASVFLATFVSTLSSYGSESAFLELQRAAANVTCRVRRDGKTATIPASELVVGDVVLIEAGEKIPADGALIKGGLSVDQSALNGESAEAEKIPLASETDFRGEAGQKGGGLARKDGLFAGSVATAGEGVMRVERVGDRTFYGQMAREMQDEPPDSPLKIKLAHLAKILSIVGYIAAVLIAVADLFNVFLLDNGMNFAAALADFKSWRICLPRLMHALTLAIAVVVVAVPEGLPMMIAVVLSSNIVKMQKDNVLVRKPVGIEAAGGLNILFTDKTGTLTKGELEAAELIKGDGHGFDELEKNGSATWRLFELSAVFNTGATRSQNGEIAGGNSTDRAILKRAVSGNGARSVEVAGAERRSFLPFDSARKYSAAFVTADGNIPVFKNKCTFLKGAPEKILPACTRFADEDGALRPFDLKAVDRQMRRMTSRGMRVVAVAAAEEERTRGKDDLSELVFIALVGIRDDLRDEVKDAVREVLGAGVQVVMITGDNLETAKAIAKEAGLFAGNGAPLCLTGTELQRVSDEELKELLPRLRVVARALPTDKSRLVRIAQGKGLVTGMTGDGVNDAPALKKADVGFAMGGGTEVAKEAGDIVILDNNFASIAKAIRYGRTITKSIKKFVVFQLTMNFCAVGVSLIAPFIGVDTPVTVTQMLWINMIMDALAGMAFSGETALKEYMKEPPERRGAPVLERRMALKIAWMGTYTVGLCLAVLKLSAFRALFRYDEASIHLYTAFFALFVFSGLFNAFNARTSRLNLFANLKQNKFFVLFILFVAAIQLLIVFFGGAAFRTAGMTGKELFIVLLLSATVIPADLIRKVIFGRVRKRKKAADRLREGYGKRKRGAFGKISQKIYKTGTRGGVN